jgi:putative ABC transport system permease protein
MTARLRPPRLAEAILSVVLPRDVRDALLADLADAHAHPSRRHRDAWYWGQALRAWWPPTIIALHLQQRHRERFSGAAPFHPFQEGSVNDVTLGAQAFVQDLRFAVRSLRKQRGLTFIAIFCLALGIGANTAIFSVVRAVLLESLPFREPERLYRLYETYVSSDGSRYQNPLSVPEFNDWRQQARSFEALAGYSVAAQNVREATEAVRVQSVRATAALFRVLGAQPALGRTFAPDEDQPGQPNVVVLSDGYWRRRYAASPAVLDSSLTIDTTQYRIIGVMPPAFDYPIGTVQTDMWMPMAFSALETAQRGNHWLSVIGRLKPGVDSARAAREISSTAVAIIQAHPAGLGDRVMELTSLRDTVVGPVKKALMVLLGAVGLVLLIACANVANLLLARASGRRREVAIRTALGAARPRLVRQLLTESIVLAVAGGLAGIVVAYAGLRALLVLAASALPRADAVGLDPGVLLFTAIASIATGLAFGIVPAVRATRTDLREDLSDSAGRTTGARQQHRLLDGLVAAEIALSLVLLVGAGLLMRGFVNLVGVDPGLDPKNLLTFQASSPATVADSLRYRQFFGPVLDRIRTMPGVRSGAMIHMLPFQSCCTSGKFTIVGRPPETDPARMTSAEFRVISDEYFRTMRIPMREGRDFSPTDNESGPRVVIVNQELARRFFPGESAIGKQVYAWSRQPSTIVGIAADVRSTGLDQELSSELYISARQQPGWAGTMTFVVGTQGAPEPYSAAIRGIVRDVAPTQSVFQVMTMEAVIAKSVQSRKLILVLLGVFASIALLLSAVGVYGLMSYGVSQRQREIGIRMALGARRADIGRMFLVYSARVAMVGVVIGVAIAAATTGVLESMLYGVSERDPLTFVVVPMVLGGVALLATWIPARRAARVDPMVTIRTD